MADWVSFGLRPVINGSRNVEWHLNSGHATARMLARVSTEARINHVFAQMDTSSPELLTTAELLLAVALARDDRPAPVISEQQRGLTLAELARYNGKEDSKIYIAVRRTVYDVSSGASFYGPDAGYSVFAGKDATRCLATMSLEEKDTNDLDYEPKNQEDKETLDGWEKKYKEKYPIVGTVIESTSSIEPLLIQLKEHLSDKSDIEACKLDLLCCSSQLLTSKDHENAKKALVAIAGEVAGKLDQSVFKIRPGNQEVFVLFENYDFESDATFLKGLSTVQQSTSKVPEDKEKWMLQAKAFYFSKCIAPFNLLEYLSWKTSSKKQVTKSMGASVASTPLEKKVDGEPSLSFTEVMELVKAGKEVPGVRKVSVAVAESDTPSESKTDKPKKPWEQTES
eukprot:m.251396 g.251396  ORF g.251396 m.251396 type:complete len:396 (-) comp16148_c0_seq19:2276-3463(-)